MVVEGPDRPRICDPLPAPLSRAASVAKLGGVSHLPLKAMTVQRPALLLASLMFCGAAQAQAPAANAASKFHPWQAAAPRLTAEAYFTHLEDGDKIETPYVLRFGLSGGWGLARGALAAARHLAEGGNDPFYAAKVVTARFYSEQILPPAAALLGPITRGADNLLAIPPEQL